MWIVDLSLPNNYNKINWKIIDWYGNIIILMGVINCCIKLHI